jgi:transcriptional regulator with XRE-family HTH domain
MKYNARQEFGRQVARLRRQSMLTVEQLAQMADIKPVTLKHIEQGAFNVPFDILNRLAVVLGGELQIVINDLTK